MLAPNPRPLPPLAPPPPPPPLLAAARGGRSNGIGWQGSAPHDIFSATLRVGTCSGFGFGLGFVFGLALGFGLRLR